MNTESVSKKQKGNAVLHGVISRAFSYSFLPKWMQESAKIASLISEEITKTEKKLGKQKTEDLVIQFKNEAYAQRCVNHEYMINKLRAARHGL